MTRMHVEGQIMVQMPLSRQSSRSSPVSAPARAHTFLMRPTPGCACRASARKPAPIAIVSPQNTFR